LYTSPLQQFTIEWDYCQKPEQTVNCVRIVRQASKNVDQQGLFIPVDDY